MVWKPYDHSKLLSAASHLRILNQEKVGLFERSEDIQQLFGLLEVQWHLLSAPKLSCIKCILCGHLQFKTSSRNETGATSDTS